MYVCKCKIIAHAVTISKSRIKKINVAYESRPTGSGEQNNNFFQQCFVCLSEIVWFLKFLTFC